MKFWHILMFLVIFNVSIIMVSSLHIYNLSGYGTGPLPDDPNQDLKDWAYALVEGAIASAVLGTFITYLTKVPSDAAAAYSLMSVLYITVASKAVAVIRHLSSDASITLIVYLFGGILVFVWAGAMLQMIRGGWRTYE